MRTGGLQRALDQLRLAGGGLADGQLLTRFLDGHDQAAFAALVRRHGPMVLGVCRRVLGHEQDAEDAFQAAFLILARKAASVARREAVASFLYTVAYRAALRARVRAARRRATERQVDPMPDPPVAPPEAQDWRPLLDRELSRLPEKYRAAVVLCDLEGKTRREAARQLGLPEGTLASRLATARRMLARRLAKCGLSLSGGALAAALAETAAAAVPAPWVSATAKAAALVAAGRAAAAATPATLLMNEVLRAMLLTKLKLWVVAALAVVLLGAGGIAYQAAGQAPGAGARPLTDLEVLRREVQILKLQVELLQEKVRGQEEALRALRRPAGPAGATGAREALPWLIRSRPQAPQPPGGLNEFRHGLDLPGAKKEKAPPDTKGRPDAKPAEPNELRHRLGPPSDQPDKEPSDPVQQAEAALRLLREARDEATRQRAADALERALHMLRRQPLDGSSNRFDYGNRQ
jgi:RNA polymerase sigma factor (sigma-70 family)